MSLSYQTNVQAGLSPTPTLQPHMFQPGPVGGWNKIYPNGTKFTHFLSPYSELPMRFRHQKFKKSDRLVKKLSCNTGLHIIFPVYILKILLPKNYF